MCGCFVVLLGAFLPRVALLLMALFNDDISNAFHGNWVAPVAGFFLLPYTTLVYVLISTWQGGVAGFNWFFVALAFMVDVGSYGGGYQHRSDLHR